MSNLKIGYDESYQTLFIENSHTESYFNYEIMGFGEVIKEHDELTNTIVRHMANNCVIDEKYKQRAENFFAYNDENNNQHVYDEIIKI